jgi:hypothetical protein
MSDKVAEAFEIKEDIAIEDEFNTWWERVKPPEYESSFKSAVKNAYYAGAGNMGYIMTQLSKQTAKKKIDGGSIVDRLFVEIHEYFADLVTEVEKVHGEQFKR